MFDIYAYLFLNMVVFIVDNFFLKIELFLK